MAKGKRIAKLKETKPAPSCASGKIEYGNVEIDAHDLRPENAKVRVTMWVDGDIVEAYRAAASEQHIGYQTLMNQTLRMRMPTSGVSMQDILDRLAMIERSMERKKA